MRTWLNATMAIALVAAYALVCPARVEAQGVQYDLSWMEPQQTQVRAAVNNSASAVRAQISRFDVSSRGIGSNTGSFGNTSQQTWSQSVALPTARRVGLDPVETGILAENSVDGSAIPSGQFDYGFPRTGPSRYRGAYSGQVRSLARGGRLPQVSTSSVDINICDEGGIGGGGGGTGGSGSGTGGAEPQGPPALPPGWTGVMCHGIYAGAIPPGGTVAAFWRGEYGFAGDAAQQEALRREGQWLLANGQI